MSNTQIAGAILGVILIITGMLKTRGRIGTIIVVMLNLVVAYLWWLENDLSLSLVFCVVGFCLLLSDLNQGNKKTIIEPPSRPLFSDNRKKPVVTVLARCSLPGLVITYGNVLPPKNDPADLLTLRIKDPDGWEMDAVLVVIVPRNVYRFRLEWDGDQKLPVLYLVNSATAQRYCGSVVTKQRYETVSFAC